MNRFFLIFCPLFALLFSCTGGQSSCSDNYSGVETTVHSINESYTYPIDPRIETADGFWMEVMSDSIDYFRLASDIKRTPQIDSLINFYNICTAANAIHSDSYLRSREYDWEPNGWDSSCIKDATAQGLLDNLFTAAQSKFDAEEEDKYFGTLANSFDKLNEYIQENYFSAFEAKIDTMELAKKLEREKYVKDWTLLSNKIKDKTVKPRELRERVIEEKYFVPQTLLSELYALSCCEEKEHRHVATGLLESILTADIYSPYLPEIWRMWRCRIQIDMLSPSNDGLIQNHLYNAMRNRVAATILREYAATGQSDALDAFLQIATEYNIIRSGSFIGNYATLEDMSLFWEPTRPTRKEEKREE